MTQAVVDTLGHWYGKGTMGRHSGQSQVEKHRDGSLLAWGLFLGCATVTAAAMTGLDLVSAGLAGAGLVAIFSVLWIFSLRSRQDG
ncbi:hypothetical protein [Arthrobacter roseus]|uniref:hypothetical protein n=1 Tax=Arthrobacter roseus TaxID=136274 RepID=UPI0019626E51|nr:hypothetical protein [Arthrobacter roseus]MBM7848814.1 hypothetical protein [Arthrobacter roseus]